MDINNILNRHKPEFERYLKLLLKWNKAYNLTAVTSPDEVREKHFYDSLAPLKDLPDRGTLLDIGCGAGFPGIPLKLARPALSVMLLDAVDKKCLFCEAVIRELGLKDINVVHGRAEDKKIQERLGRFDAVISRAAFPLKRYIAMARPYLKEGSSLIAMKGAGVQKELAEAGVKASRLEEYSLPKSGARRYIITSSIAVR
jgi:16S rRNA (guanine527-N7)-methyltransferase